MQSQLSSKYEELNKKAKEYWNRIIRNSLIAFGGLSIFFITQYLFPPSASSEVSWPRVALATVEVVMLMGGLILMMRDDVDLNLEQRWFLRTFGVVT